MGKGRTQEDAWKTSVSTMNGKEPCVVRESGTRWSYANDTGRFGRGAWGP